MPGYICRANSVAQANADRKEEWLAQGPQFIVVELEH